MEGIINRYKSNDELLTPDLLKFELKRRKKEKEITSFSSLPLLTLLSGWEQDYFSKTNVSDATKTRTKSVIKHIIDYVIEIERKRTDSLMINDIKDETFLIGFMDYLFNIPTINGKGLKPSSAARRFKYLQSFCKYYSKLSNEYISISIPKELSTSTTIDKNEPPIYLNQNELIKLVI